MRWIHLFPELIYIWIKSYFILQITWHLTENKTDDVIFNYYSKYNFVIWTFCLLHYPIYGLAVKKNIVIQKNRVLKIYKKRL